MIITHLQMQTQSWSNFKKIVSRVLPRLFSSVEIQIKKCCTSKSLYHLLKSVRQFSKTPFQSARRLIWVYRRKRGLRECKNTLQEINYIGDQKSAKIRYFCDSCNLQQFIRHYLWIGTYLCNWFSSKKSRCHAKKMFILRVLHWVVLCAGNKHCGLVWSDG